MESLQWTLASKEVWTKWENCVTYCDTLQFPQGDSPLAGAGGLLGQRMKTWRAGTMEKELNRIVVHGMKFTKNQ